MAHSIKKQPLDSHLLWDLKSFVCYALLGNLCRYAEILCEVDRLDRDTPKIWQQNPTIGGGNEMSRCYNSWRSMLGSWVPRIPVARRKSENEAEAEWILPLLTPARMDTRSEPLHCVGTRLVQSSLIPPRRTWEQKMSSSPWRRQKQKHNIYTTVCYYRILHNITTIIST